MGKRIIQRHHISYDPEVIVPITKGEHAILTKIQWYTKKFVSKGFLTALEVFLALNRNRGEDL